MLLKLLSLEPTRCIGYDADMAAQNQHYVPKFVLRHFLADATTERVNVYDKHDDRSFVTSIKNIMAERRFNEFAFDDDYIASFEPIACGAEDQVLPAYREVIAHRRLDDRPEQKAALAVFLAFQFLRTKSHRDQWRAMEEETVKMVEASGGRMQDMQGWENWQPATEDSLKREHLMSIQGHIGEVAQIIGQKDFLLMEPAPGTNFYLGDNPVVLANSRDFGPYGNLGLAVAGIEIYMPLSADFLLCAWCPSILAGIRERLPIAQRECEADALARVARGELDAAGMRQILKDFAAATRDQRELVTCAAEGLPISSLPINMEYYNSLQTSYAYRYVIDKDGDFDLARRVNRENPQFQRGRRMQAN